MFDFTLKRTTIGGVLGDAASSNPAAEAAVFLSAGRRWRWSDLQREAEAVARGLLALGVESGDPVAIWGTNRPEWLLTQLGAALIGAPLVTINPEWKTSELEYALKQSGSRVLVMYPGFTKGHGEKKHVYDYRDILAPLLPELAGAGREPLQAAALPDLDHVVLVDDDVPAGYRSWARFIADGAGVDASDLAAARAAVSPDDVCLIQYTSGTTGFPKGALLTHLGVVNNARAAAANMRLDQRDRICVVVPYYHCFGSILANLGALVSGAAMIVPSDHFNPHLALAAVDAERCTVLHGVPTMFISELEDRDFETHDLSTLRTGIMAGAPCPVELMRHVVGRLGLREITIGYGLTEASPLTHQTSPDDPLDKRIETVGRPLPETEARIVDPGTFETLPQGQVGEIWVRGYNVMKGYFRRPEDTAEAIHDGWLRTGDLGQIDADGYYRVVGRLKEMVIVGGHNVYPAEVEQTILSMFEDRLDIVQVVGLPHPRLQEVVALAARARPGATITEEQILQRCRQEMEWPKVPRRVLFMDDFSPVMTVTGKIQKFRLRELMTAAEPVAG